MRRGRAAGAAVVVALVAGVVAVPAWAADPPGTVVLATGNSAYGEFTNLDGVAGGQLVIGTAKGIFAEPVAGGTRTKLTSSTQIDAVAGNYLWYGDPQKWLNLTNLADTGTVPTEWSAPSPDGGVFVGTVAKPHDVFDQTTANAGTATATDLGAIPVGVRTVGQLLAGPNGVVVDSFDASYTTEAWTYFPFSGTGPVPLDVSGLGYLSCGSVSSVALGCSGADVVAVPLNGSAPVVTAGQTPNEVVATHDVLAWTSYDDHKMHSVPIAGGTVSTLSTPVVMNTNYEIAADESKVYLNVSGAFGTAGIYSTPDAATAATKVDTDPVGALRAFDIALGAGRAAWEDDRQTNHPVWSRSLSTSGGSIVAGGQTLTATGATYFGLSISGTRTAYTTNSAVTVKRGSSSTTITNVVPLDPFFLSGTRLAYLAETATSLRYIVRNLITGAATNVTTSLGISHVIADRQQVSLWGNYLAYVKNDGSVWRKDLSSSAAPVKIATAPSAAQGGRAVNWGDWVAYTRYYSGAFHSALRNARTLAAPQALPAGAAVVQASAGGLVYQTSTGAYRFRTWASSTAHALPISMPRDFNYNYVREAPPVVSGSQMAWVGADGAPRVAPLPVAVKDRPRSLGNPHANHGLKLGSSWTFDLVTSAVLTHCAVRIKNSSGVIVRTLACDAASAHQGEIVASWDGKNATGHRVSPGTFTWTVVASNGDGSLLNANGSTTATSGKISVTS